MLILVLMFISNTLLPPKAIAISPKPFTQNGAISPLAKNLIVRSEAAHRQNTCHPERSRSPSRKYLSSSAKPVTEPRILVILSEAGHRNQILVILSEAKDLRRNHIRERIRLPPFLRPLTAPPKSHFI
jgi:hypothetical protein